MTPSQFITWLASATTPGVSKHHMLLATLDDLKRLDAPVTDLPAQLKLPVGEKIETVHARITLQPFTFNGDTAVFQHSVSADRKVYGVEVDDRLMVVFRDAGKHLGIEVTPISRH
ncbi:MAG TPA: hypothetical protein ENH55_13855 [Aurantimonas coralicida]|uniref:Uncharacterized protein n=2 Tax=root TaxID=1 RepID=A0A9C9NGL2_9HYPH|nr:hypothetical protein [Aurantimonas coralicida]HEU00974.1 hypothetical protein [Aurantimonas coralicida]